MNFLMIGDICGKPGRQAAVKYIPMLKEKYRIDVVVANGENSANGIGITKSVYGELTAAGIDIVTSGNHIWDKKEALQLADDTPNLIRPANYPPGAPGKGYCIFAKGEKKIGVFNLSGRSFMPALDCPFRKADEIVAELRADCDFIILDFHAETTSEKMAMGWYLDGRVSCVAGTHTHIQTADERVLPKGTAYITDLGMVGPWNSVLGVQKERVIQKFVSAMPVKFELAAGPNVFCGIVLFADDERGCVREIQRVMIRE